MDDFGTGYSSLSSLQSFPFDKIKIDRSFVSRVDSNPQSAAIVRAVIGLGNALNIPIIAEGVETESERDFLRARRMRRDPGLSDRPSPADRQLCRADLGSRCQPSRDGQLAGPDCSPARHFSGGFRSLTSGS